MRNFFALILFTFSSVVSAGDYHTNRVDTYDPATGLYYKAVLSRESRGFISKNGGSDVVNIAIYNPTTETITLLFKEAIQGAITRETLHKHPSHGMA